MFTIYYTIISCIGIHRCKRSKEKNSNLIYFVSQLSVH